MSQEKHNIRVLLYIYLFIYLLFYYAVVHVAISYYT